ncbi:MAG: hypothetical protein M3301_00240 [Chloroflexota bacterium]|nr:hypothetical protein [Chloroflexota bacterium]
MSTPDSVDDIEAVLARLGAHGAELVGEVADYEHIYRLCYVRGPEGIIVGLAEQLELKTADAAVPTRSPSHRTRCDPRRSVVGAGRSDRGEPSLLPRQAGSRPVPLALNS